MRRYLRKTCAIWMSFVLCGACQPNNDSVRATPDYEVVCYCETDETNPIEVVRMDNNRDLLLACQNGKTRDQLHAEKIASTESQIRALLDWRLLEDKDGVLRSAVPILLEPETQALRLTTVQVATEISTSIVPDVKSFADTLKGMGHEASAYSILFSYVLDGLVFDQFEVRKALVKRAITDARPFWSGVLWGLFPKRPFSCGTNSMDGHDLTLKVLWSRSARKLMGPFISDWGSVTQLFEAIGREGRVNDVRLRGLFNRYGVLDTEGRPTIPIVDEANANPIYSQAKSLAGKIAGQVLTHFDLAALQLKFRLANKEDALVIAYHELMWDLLGQLEQAGVVRRPPALAAPDQAQASDVSSLVFLVRHAGSSNRDVAGEAPGANRQHE